MPSSPQPQNSLRQFFAANTPKPKPFDMSEPFNDRGLWCFWLTADTSTIDFVTHLNCVLSSPNNPFARRPVNRMLIYFNPRYDYQEVWLWIHELLQEETQFIELDAVWDEAIQNACESEISEEE